MKMKAKLVTVSLFTLMVTGIFYSKIASAATCVIWSGVRYCF